MKRYFLAFFVLIAACAAGCLPGGSPQPQPTPNVPSPPATLSDQAFVTTIGQLCQTQVQAGQLAQSHASSAGVKDFAALTIRVHSRLAADLQALAQQNGFTFPTGVGSENQRMLDDLATKEGRQFDKFYIDDTIVDEEQMIQLFQEEAAGGQSQSLQAWAGQNVHQLDAPLRWAEKLAARLQ